MKKILLVAIFISSLHNAFSQLSMPRIFANAMVLQRNAPIPFWGKATPNASIVISINTETKDTKADSLGHWKILLDSMKAGGPYSVVITEKRDGSSLSELQFQNVMIGDVWLASGQSNMELKLSESLQGNEEIMKANVPNIRFFIVPHDIETEPQQDVKSGHWQVSESTSASNFSAVAYYFSKQISQEQGVAIGIIQSTWGGTPVETWTSREALMTIPEYSKKIQENSAANISQASFDADKKNENTFFDIALNSLNGEHRHFTETTFNDSLWDIIIMPQTFRDSSNFQDILWMRKTIDIPKTMTGKELTLNLGYPEILYNMYFNGTLICRNIWNAQKQHLYAIPSNLVNQGKNVITLRLAVMWGGGGIDNPADSLYITDGHQTISLAGSWHYIKHIETPFPQIKNYHKYPSYLFNGMINPVIPYALKGFLWYQGEENAAYPQNYANMFALMINDWRAQWQQGALPFVFVQLPNYMKRVSLQAKSNWALIREAQRKTLSVPNTAMAVTIDLGQADDIHPKNKADVGYRLALAAEHVAYNKTLVYSGPQFEQVVIDKSELRVLFRNPESGGLLVHGDTLKGFEIAGADKRFYQATATVYRDWVILKSPAVSKPVAVRYGWGDNPDCNLYNKEGLPASPFRTDDWLSN